MLNVRGDVPNLLYDRKTIKEHAVEYRSLNKGVTKASIMSDVMFKTMLQNNSRLKYSARFISYYLDIEEEELLKSIRLVKNELDKKKKDEKGERCDYVAEVNGTTINIEVNNNDKKEVMERNMEYAHRLYVKEVKVGSKEEYRQVIQINLNNFAFLGNDKIVDVYYMQNREGIKLNNKLIFIQIYIPNLRKKCYNEGKDNLSKEEKYALLLVEPDVELSKELAEGDNLMEEYLKESKEVSEWEGFGESYDKEWALRDQGLRDGIAKGLVQGIETGKAEKKIEMVKAMLSKGANIQFVSECSGMSVGELEKIRETVEVNLGESYDKEWALRDQGLRDGIAKGKEENKIEMVKAMLSKGINIKLVSECSGMSVGELEKIRETIEVNLGESYDKERLLREQEQIEIAKNMLKDSFSLEDISKYTTLTIEQIKNIKKD